MDPQDLANLDDALVRTTQAICAARRSSRWQALDALRENAGAFILLDLVVAGGLWYLLELNLVLVALGLLVPAILGWLLALIAYPRVFAPSAEADSELHLAYTNAERILGDLQAETDGALELGWGSATPNTWSYTRQLATVEATRRELAGKRRALAEPPA